MSPILIRVPYEDAYDAARIDVDESVANPVLPKRSRSG